MSKEDVKIDILYEDLVKTIEEVLANENAEILLETDAEVQAATTFVKRVAANMADTAEIIGAAFDQIIDMYKGTKVFVTGPVAEKIRVIATFLDEVAKYSKSRKIKGTADKLFAWASKRADAKAAQRAREVINPPKLTAFVNRFYGYAKRGLSILKTTKGKVGTGVLAGVVTGGVLLYKKYLGQAARACKGKDGIEKQQCLVKFRINGYKAEISLLRSSLPQCEQTNDAMTCRKKIEDRIKSLQEKIKNLEKK